MKNRFDQIENRLQILIENSSFLFTWGVPSIPVARRLVETMLENLSPDNDGSPLAKNLYTVFLPSESYLLWKDNQELTSSLSENLERIARENGIHFSSAPVIRVSLKTELHADGIEIMVSNTQEVPGVTSSMEPGTPDPPTDKTPINAFLIINGTVTYPLDKNVINIGRRENNHLVINDPRVSRNHAQLRAVKDRFVLFDLNSSGGTYVNGMRIYQHRLQAGDVISLAGVALVYGEDALFQPIIPGEDTTSSNEISGMEE